MRLWNKLTSRRGETLTETLAAILVISLSSVVLASMLGAASRMNATAIARDKALYAAVSKADTMQAAAASPGKVAVTIGGAGITFGSDTPTSKVTYYSDKEPDGTLYAYHYQKNGGGAE